MNAALDSVAPEQLRGMELFEGECPVTIAWIASRMVAHTFASGEQMVKEGDPAQSFLVVLEGEIHFQRYEFHELIIVPAGQATGVLPFSLMKTWAGRGWAAVDSRVAAMDASHLRELVYRAPLLAQRLVSAMTERTRLFTRMQESSNRLVALGKLSAGLAHELNNPASAAVRSASRLRGVLARRFKGAVALRGQVLSPEARDLLSELGELIVTRAQCQQPMDSLEKADRESELAEWLERVGLSDELAGGLADAGLTLDEVGPLAALLPAEEIEIGLGILQADHEILCLAHELEDASIRISSLVEAVKAYSYMDQNPIADVDVEQGVQVTLRMFQHRIHRGITVCQSLSGNLPRVRANGSALNQIWTNLIDNALDALESLPKGAERVLSIRTQAEPGAVRVEIGDTGRGIPAEVQARIFDPFFTTKAVGEGAGLGLAVVQRIVRSHKASMSVKSRPGRTVFCVHLPHR